MKQLPKLLSKTKLMRGYQCLKSIYLTVHHKELEPPVTPELQSIFEQGNKVGERAREKFPEGVLVENPAWDFFGALKKTRELLKEETQVIFEAAFEYQGCFARADMIVYSQESKRWSIYEVKSTTKIKDEHYDDIGLQAWIMANAGLPIEKIILMHLNNECKYPNLVHLFKENDVTDEIRQRYLNIPHQLNNIFKALRSPETPSVDIGPHCSVPNECPFVNQCWKEKRIPDLSIFNLPSIKSKKWELYQEGIINLDDPRLIYKELSSVQLRAIEVFKNKERFIDRLALQELLKNWKFPLIFLDFETINPAIPRYNQTTPYQQVPFQFSVHVCESLDAQPIHHEYLHTEPTDPRASLLSKLLEVIPATGSIVAYYCQFESQRLMELADYFPQHQHQIQDMISRFVDPLPLFREHVYDNDFAGSFSLKSVAPAILGQKHSYQDMPIENGTAAQRAFEEIINPDTEQSRREYLIQASLEYCKKDTLVMVELVKWLMVQSSLA